MTGRFRYEGMTIEVEELRAEITGESSWWLRRVDTDPQTTIGVRRHSGLAIANTVDLDAGALDRALTAHLADR